VGIRVAAALGDIAADAGSHPMVLVGTHAGPIGAAARWAAGVPDAFRGGFTGVGNTSITTLRFPGPRLVGFNRS
jgi:broad specificity phosphatase PhoE